MESPSHVLEVGIGEKHFREQSHPAANFFHAKSPDVGYVVPVSMHVDTLCVQ